LKSDNKDIELLVKFSNGDTDAFDQLFNKYSSGLYAFGLKYLKSSDEAEELVQAVFMIIWENSHHINIELSFKSFLFTIAYNEICKAFRKRRYWQKYVSQVQFNLQQIIPDEEDPDISLMMDQVHQIIEDLPEKQKTVFKKSKFEGKSAREIAQEMELSPGTVDNYISECLKYIRSRLSEK
jgi:RNA polymerase sigma-70 factor (family 1)